MIHLVKLCVGISSVEELEAYRAERLALGLGRADGNHQHRTRMTPKRAEDLVGQGSLYWVIGGFIRARQRIVGLEATTDNEERGACLIVMEPKIIRTVLQPKRPFQGWRYLPAEDAPADIDGQVGDGDEVLAEELARLGLL